MARTSLTSSNRFYITTGKSLSELIKKTEELGNNTLLMADGLVASIASDARRHTKNDHSVTMGGVYRNKWVQKKKGSFMAQGRGSIWNDSTGTWVSRTYHTGNGPFRLMNFNFETTAWKRKYAKSKNGIRRGYSEVSLTSQVANLWEFPATYKKDSWGLFRKNNEWGGWPKGTRKARPFFYDKTMPAVKNAMPRAINKAYDKLNKDWFKV